jgi:hypothetical protein
MTIFEESRKGDIYHLFKTKFVPYGVLVDNRLT